MTEPFHSSPFQERIFSFTADRSPANKHGIVSAVAGSGKTTTLAHASQLIGTSGLFCAFNKHIAEALKLRLAKNMRATTVHAIGMSTLYAAGWRSKPQVDESKYWTIVREYSATADDLKGIDRAIPRIVAMARFARLTLTDYTKIDDLHAMSIRYGLDWDEKIGEAIAPVVDRGRLLAMQSGAIDFTDMLYLPHAFGLRPRQHQFVFVDECQDLSKAQLELVMQCIAPGGRSLWVGDPSQAIMQFAGADSQSYYAIKERTGAVELPLSICYRCPTAVLDLARKIVPHILPRPNAPAGVVRQVGEEALLSAREGDLIMCRRNAPLVKHCLRLIRRGIQARVRGRDIGKELADTVRDIGRHVVNYFQFPAIVDRHCEKHLRVLNDSNAPPDQIEMFSDTCAAIIECFEGFSECRSVSALAEKIESIFSDVNASIWFSSIHRAKGLEADRTFVLNFSSLGTARDGANREQAMQEVNLKYVAITRAKQCLNTI